MSIGRETHRSWTSLLLVALTASVVALPVAYVCLHAHNPATPPRNGIVLRERDDFGLLSELDASALIDSRNGGTKQGYFFSSGAAPVTSGRWFAPAPGR